MEQRPLLAIALVAGCVTAAGAGGYLALRQDAAPPTTVASSHPEAAATSPAVEGTEGEILPPADPPVPVAPATAATPDPTPVAPRRATSAASQVHPTVPPRAAPAPPVRAPERTADTSRPSVPAPREQPVASTEVTRSTPARTDTNGTSGAAPDAASPRDGSWPASGGGDARQTAANEWPNRANDQPADDSSLPSQGVDAPPPSAAVARAESVTIPADAVIGVQLESSVSSQTARVEDPVRARVTRDVRANGVVVVPAGSRVLGSVTLVEEGGKIRERARLGVRFHTLVLADGTEVRLPTETIYRDGDSPAGRSAAKIGGGAVGGAILGAILGGGRGAVIGAATGAGSGTAVAMAGERRPAELRSGEPVTVRVSSSVTAEVERP